MHILENVDLTPHSTMRLGGTARYLAEVNTEEDIPKLVAWAKGQGLPFMMIGQGSNIIWRDEGFPGLILVNRIAGREILAEDEAGATVRLGSGEKWDDIVAWAVGHGWSGIEFMSFIPGTVGAGPVQNIGAYGAELSSTLTEVEAFDTENNSFGGLLKEACGFGYRTSRFKTTDKGRFMITAIVLKLTKTTPSPPFYESLQQYFDQKGITEFNPSVIREGVKAIRLIKLPDPSTVANNGSFFTNPIIEKAKFEELEKQYPDIKGWTYEEKIKVSAGWLVEKAGFKDVHDPQTGMGTWPKHALVLVNEHAQHTADLLTFKQKIVDKVQGMFGIALAQEPELLP